MSKVLIFDIRSNYAHFKKPYTTTSPLTYSVPSRTTVTGIIGAILGIPKGENNTRLDKSKSLIALGIKHPIKKTRIAQNLIKTKNHFYNITDRKPTNIEYLVNPGYRIYVSIYDEPLHRQLNELLESHRSVYSVSLGLSENLAQFQYIGDYEFQEIRGEADIHSVIPVNEQFNDNTFIIEPDKEYFKDTFSAQMTLDRIVTEYQQVVFERNGQTIRMKGIDYVKIGNGENILWL